MRALIKLKLNYNYRLADLWLITIFNGLFYLIILGFDGERENE